jgi:hypothetical protein
MEDFARAHFHLLGFDRYAGSSNRPQFLASFLSLVRTLEENNWTPEKCTLNSQLIEPARDATVGEEVIAERQRGASRLSPEMADDLAAQEEILRAYSRFVGLKQRFNVYDVTQQASVLLSALEKRPRCALTPVSPTFGRTC